MKYLKPYTLFESIHPNNTNIKELDPNFVHDITDICADLNSDFPQTDKDGRLISFYSPSFRSVALKDPLSEYPSISIHMPYYMYGYKFGDKTKHDISIECPELKQVALRIKEFLGDSYKAFVLKNGPKNTIHTLSDNTSFYSGISGFQIVYDPTKFLKKFNESSKSKSKRKIGSFAIHCIDLGYTGTKGGRCSGAKNKKRKVFQGYKLPLEFGKDYYYDKKNENTFHKNPDAQRQEEEYERKAEESHKILSSVRSDVEDILLEASDEGFDYNVSINKWHKNDPFFTHGGLQDGWISELRYSMVIHIVKKGLRPEQSMFANSNYFDINLIKEPLMRLEDYVKNNLPNDYKMYYSDDVDQGWKDKTKKSACTVVTITIDNYR